MGRLDEARDDLNEAIYLQDDNSTFYYSLAIVYSYMDLDEYAIENYSRVISLIKDKDSRLD